MSAAQIPTQQRVKVVTRDQGECQRCGMVPPQGSKQWHHRRTRHVHDEHRHCTCTGVTLCPACHSWVHANPMQARAEGFTVRRTEMPYDIPYRRYDGVWVLPDCEGAFVDDERPVDLGEAVVMLPRHR